MSEHNINNLEDKLILIIDDQKSFQTLLKGMLLQLGAKNILHFPSGEAALTQFDKSTVDMVFIDYNLGQGRNGKQFLEELKYLNKLSRHCISILVTGESTRSVVLSILEVEPDDYLIKPFSTGMLRTRIAKLSMRKAILFEADQAVEENNFTKAIDCYQDVAKNHPRLAQYCSKRLCQLYFKFKQFTDAQTLLESLLSKTRSCWVLTYLAQTHYSLGNFDQAIRICDELLGQNRFNIDAIDIKALCLQQLKQTQESLFLIEQSCNIAPNSYARQQKYAEIARNTHAFEAQAKAQSNLLSLAKGTAFANIDNHFNYIRSLFNQLSVANTTSQKNEQINKINSALKKANLDECVIKEQQLFQEFSTFCKARLSACQGDYLVAKKLIAPFIAESTLSQSVLPDSIMALFDVGEFEDAARFLTQYKEHENCHVQVMNELENRKNELNQVQVEFDKHNSSGIELYKKGHYQDAVTQFELALKYAPMNTGSALNLLQAILQLLPHAHQTPELLLAKCSKTFTLVDDMALPPHHAKRLHDLKFEFNKLTKLYQS